MELKKGASRKIFLTGSLKRIWEDAMEFEIHLRSHTVLDTYMLHIEVPEKVMLDVTSDISQLCEHRFYNWVMFRDKPIQ